MLLFKDPNETPKIKSDTHIAGMAMAAIVDTIPNRECRLFIGEFLVIS